MFRGPDGILYRQINRVFAEKYDAFVSSGLCAALQERGLLVKHTDAPIERALTADAYKVIAPEPIPFISYPYEWPFDLLRKAAQTTLEIQRLALKSGMTLRDASAYNIQFNAIEPVLIDTLSFEPYAEGSPWIAYGQFCRHFLAPLALMSCTDARLGQLLRNHIDGVPLEMAAAILPRRSMLSLGLLVHLHVHGNAIASHARKGESASAQVKGRKMTRLALQGILDNLSTTIAKMRPPSTKSHWSTYTETHRYTKSSVTAKEECIEAFISRVKPKLLMDLGANTGQYSRLAAKQGAYVVSVEGDPACVEFCAQQADRERLRGVLPLCMDLSNPSPGLGWAHEERDSLAARGPVDMVLALALIHHIAIANNVPFDRFLSYTSKLATHAVIEFVPKQDEQVVRLLHSREDIFDEYTEEKFVEAASRYYEIVEQTRLPNSGRVLYLLRVRPESGPK